ncbi:MAG: SUMF1/EgtB/PvdO family nonheme iron enzyme, partial [Candidatus Sumerlaeia bacterium]|nr:SUMF1/EgtB/PvdO family nonheme iron enzyme [Candidatus Sumerlaeia bacterium]
EVQLLKNFLDDALLAEFGDEAPPSYWGNIPRDRIYTVEGMETTFRYAGLGGRVYGALNPEVAHRSIHLEFPSPIRTSEEHRPRSARVLIQFITSVRDHFHQQGIDWVDAPGGEFPFGGGTGMEALSGENTVRVSLSPFQISRTPITNRQFAEFANESLGNGTAMLQSSALVCAETDTPMFFPGPMASHSAIVIDGEGGLMTIAPLHDHPVVNVTHFGATAFAIHLGARLPTEAEWEYAAKWDPYSNRAVYWREADDIHHENLPAGNYMHSPQRQAGMVVGTTTPVGFFRNSASPIGALDMAGNVWEWTADWFANLPSTDEILQDPEGADGGTMKVTRGGSWDTEPMTIQATYRMSKAPHAALPTLGFRIVREAGE